jgi:transposase
MYKIELLLATFGHSLLCLPPYHLYHLDLNPIEMVWDTVKKWVGQKTILFKLDNTMWLAKQKLNSITAQDWASYC